MRTILAIILLCATSSAEDTFTVRYDYSGLEVAAESASGPHSLPVGVSGWNTGQTWVNKPVGTDVGFAPDWMLANDCIPSFEIYAQFQAPVNKGGSTGRYGDYYAHISQVAAKGLPLSFVLSNDMADCFRTVTAWRWDTATVPDPEDSHPFQIELDANGQKVLVKRVSVFSPGVKSFREMGELVGDWLMQVQPLYPNPPLILLNDNNEAGVSDDATRFLADYRCPQFYRTLSTTLTAAEFQNIMRRRLEEGMRLRWAEYREGLRSKLSPEWAEAIRFVGYGGFAQEAFKAGQVTTNELPFYSPAIGHEGISCSVGYISNGRLPDIVRSPMVEACNVAWAKGKYDAIHSTDLLIEPHFKWPPNRVNYPLNQCKGMMRGTCWVIRSPIARLYTDSTDTAAIYGDAMLALRDVVNEVRCNTVLARFWQHGTLLENRWRDEAITNVRVNGFGHPYNGQEHKALTPEYGPSTLADRWFIQPTSADARTVNGSDAWARPFNHTTPVNVLAICFEHQGEYLIYATAPRGDKSGTTISPCPDGPQPRFSVTVDVSVDGAFWHVVDGVATQVQ